MGKKRKIERKGPISETPIHKDEITDNWFGIKKILL